MKIAIIGANGQVGTELCLMLRQKNYDVIPIVRNKLGASFLTYQNFKCRIADVGIKVQAKEALADIDKVILAAYAMSGTAQEVRAINTNLIKHTVHYTKNNSKLIVFSSIRAFSGKVDTNTSKYWFSPDYDREKRFLEKLLKKECVKDQKQGFCFRLGHVVGGNQSKVIKFKDSINIDNYENNLDVFANQESNIVHTQTIMHACVHAFTQELKPSVYSLVNKPQWTWEEVFSYYSPGISITYKSQKNTKNKIAKLLISIIWGIALTQKSRAVKLLRYLPSDLSKKIQGIYFNKLLAKEINNYKSHFKPVFINEFGYKSIPGPFISGLSNTKTHLKELDITKYFG
jgi:dTDP-4-dehydrorhamnose reductase